MVTLLVGLRRSLRRHTAAMAQGPAFGGRAVRSSKVSLVRRMKDSQRSTRVARERRFCSALSGGAAIGFSSTLPRS